MNKQKIYKLTLEWQDFENPCTTYTEEMFDKPKPIDLDLFISNAVGMKPDLVGVEKTLHVEEYYKLK